MKKFAVIVAGGSGKRMGTEVPKQFLLLKGKPLLWYTLDSFIRAYNDIDIILVLPAEHLQRGEKIARLFDSSTITPVAGGKTRFESVRNGLKLVEKDAVVFVHDGVRCLVSVPLIQRCYNEALKNGSAVPAVSATDSVRITQKNGNHSVADRQQVRIIQTPQTFLSNIIIPAYEQEYQDSFTDEATVAEAGGYNVCLVEGDYDNIKITRPFDLMIAERILEERSRL